MAFEPNSTIYLLNVPWENNYKNVMYWSSSATQEETMLSFKVKEFKDCTFQRKDNIIRIPAHIDTLYNCNYVMYKNKNHSDKWFYAFITKMEYVNDGCTFATIETDVYNTWKFKVNIKPSFIEREHCSDDTPYSNTIAENLETGEYILNGFNFHFDENMNETRYVVAVTEHYVSGDTFVKATGGQFGGIYSGLGYMPKESVSAVNAMIEAYGSGKSDAIQSIFIAPKFLCQTDGTNAIAQSTTSKSYSILLPETPYNLNGYIPRNNKLLCYPYCYLLLTNNQGGSAIYQNEYFINYNEETGKHDREFKVHGSLTPGCSIRCYPRMYKQIDDNFDEGINLGKFPICNWNSDVYTNWITQNGVNLQYQTATGVASMISGTAQGAMMGSVGGPLGMLFGGVAGAVNGASQIMGVIGQKEQHKVIPDQSHGNINCGDVNYAMGANNFRFYDMCIRKEYAQIIDSFFDMYGYKTNKVKLPNENHRKTWWYTKTIDCNIDGAIPQEDLNKFRAIYDNGVTFWKDLNRFENYSSDNSII